VVSRRSVLGGGLAGLVALLTGCGPQVRDRAVAGELRQTYRYGPAKAQVAELRLPVRAAGAPSPRVAVLVHGGYWQAGYDRSLEDAVAADLVAHGVAVWNVDYRAVGSGGGWPSTFADAAEATDLLASAAAEHDLDLADVVAVGHSAGGQLALWLAARAHLPSSAVGASPKVRPRAVVSQSGVDDLSSGSRQGLGGGAVDALLGGSPAQVPERYAVADPSLLLPLGVPLLVVTGSADELVPPSQSQDFAAAARSAGDTVTLDVVPGEGHFDHLDPRSGVWSAALTWLLALPRPT
jgi:acetyl esterase/lipase